MAARALASAAGRRVAGHAGCHPALASCRGGGGGGAQDGWSRGVHAQAEERGAAEPDRDSAAAAAGVTAEQVEAALNSKNMEDVLQEGSAAAVLPEEVVDAGENADAAWVPDEETGVFVPAEEAAAGADGGPHEQPQSGSSVLDQTVFVREEEMEDVERPAVDIDNGADAKGTRIPAGDAV